MNKCARCKQIIDKDEDQVILGIFHKTFFHDKCYDEHRDDKRRTKRVFLGL